MNDLPLRKYSMNGEVLKISDPFEHTFTGITFDGSQYSWTVLNQEGRQVQYGNGTWDDMTFSLSLSEDDLAVIRATLGRKFNDENIVPKYRP